MIRETLPAVGTKLVAYRRKPTRHTVYGEIVADDSFPLNRALQVGENRYGSLSAGARAIRGSEANGWLMWKNVDGSPLRRSS
jgi:hypothetical protein